MNVLSFLRRNRDDNMLNFFKRLSNYMTERQGVHKGGFHRYGNPWRCAMGTEKGIIENGAIIIRKAFPLTLIDHFKVTSFCID